jgi:hypothetical protein
VKKTREMKNESNWYASLKRSSEVKIQILIEWMAQIHFVFRLLHGIHEP